MSFDEAYVTSILEAAAKAGPMSSREFLAFCYRDRMAGYIAEVQEAQRRYGENDKPTKA